MKKTFSLIFLSSLLFFLFSGHSYSQLTGSKSIPGDYASISLAITDLNTQGVGAGGVTFNVAAGYTETAANLTITATGTSSNPIVFQKSGAGLNPLITAGVGVSTTLDGIIKLSGCDYITFDGIDVKEDAGNVTTTTQMEWGYAVLKVDGTNGSRYVTIKNCTITLDKSNTNTRGIYSANHTIASNTALTLTDTLGANSNNKFYSNIISNCNSGIWIGGSSLAAFYDQNNEVGVTGGRQNKISNYATTTTAYGVYGIYQNYIKIFSTNIDNSGGAAATSTLYGIFLSTGTNSNADIFNDTISIAGGGTTSSIYAINSAMGATGTNNTVNIVNNVIQNCSYSTATSGAMYYIYQSTSVYDLNITGNKIINNTYGSASVTGTGTNYFIYAVGGTATNNNWSISNNTISDYTRTQSALGAGIHYLIYTTASGPTLNINNNTIRDLTIPSTSTSYGIYASSAIALTININNNTIRNINRPNASTGGFYNIYQNDGAAGGTANISGNSISNITISSSGSIYGMYSSASMDKNIYGDTIYNLNTTGGSIYGLYSSTGNTTKIYNNKVSALYTTSGTVYGGYITSGTTNYFYNNFISDLKATTATSAVSIAGVYSSGGTNNYLFYNSIFLNAVSSSATIFGTAGIYASTTPVLELRNNIIVNLSTPGPTGGYASAYFRNAFNLSSYAAASNNNVFYAGTPSANRLVYNDGTYMIQNVSDFKLLVAPRDAYSFSENPTFINVSTPPYDLHINASVPTGIESGGSPVTAPISITNDYDLQTRNILAPDIGADEGTFILGDLQAPAISYTPLNFTNNTGNRTLIAAITDNISLQNTPPDDPRIYYKKGLNGVYKYRNKTSQAGNDFTFTIVVDSVGGLTNGDTVFYYVAAQDIGTPPLSPNCGTNPIGGSGINPPGTNAPAVPSFYIIVQPPITGTYSIPGTPYATIASAINDITMRGVGTGGAIFNVAAGYTETAANLLLDNSNSSVMSKAPGNPIIFQKSGSGANPLITAGTGTGTLDGIIKISGIDNVTFDGIDVTEDYVNNITAVTQMEWGYAVLKTDGSNGSQYITIKNCSITLDKTNTGTVGIYSANHTPASSVSLVVSDTAGSNSNNKFYSNRISNVNTGIWIAGYTDAAPYLLYDQNNEVGTTGSLQNMIFNFGSTATAYGVYVISQNWIKIFNTNINNTGGAAATGALYGIYTSTGVNSNVDIYSDTVTVVSGGTTGVLGAIYNATGATGTNNSINIYNNVIKNCTYDAATSATMYYMYMSAGGYNVNIHDNKIINNTYGSAATTATGTMYFIYTFGGTAASNNWQINNNTISNNSRIQSALGSGTVYLLYNSASGPTMTVNGNLISDNVLPSSGSVYCMYMTSSYMTAFNFYNNTVRNISRPNASTGGTYCMYLTGGAANGVANIYNNSVNNISVSGAGLIYGLYSSNSNIDKNIYQDTIYNLSTEGSYIYGIYSASGITTKIYQNRIYGLNVGTDTTGYVYGGYITGGTTNHIYNNFISDLKAPASTSALAVAGLYFSGGTTDNVFYNSIYLNALSSSTTTFGTAGVYMTASASYTLDMRDNIIVNVSAPGPTGGLTAAYRRSTTTLTSYSANSNNNDLYAGIPAYNRVIFYDGTNADSMFTAFQTRVAPRDAVSFTENPPFINVTTAPYDLHLSTSVPTKCESGGIPISTPISIVNDYENDARNAVSPDVGADEGNFMLGLPSAPVLVAPLNGATGQLLTLLLDWNNVLTATSYQVQVSKDSLFTTSVLDSSGITASQLTVPAGRLGYDSIYYWKVRATNPSGAGPWCSKWNFRTELGLITYNLTIIPGGFYNSSTGTLSMKDTVMAYLVDSASCLKVDSARTVIDSLSFTGQFIFANAVTGSYYLIVYHRNHLGIATRFEQNVVRGSTMSYDFTTDSSKAFGFNMVKVSTSPVRWAMIPGDANRDGFIDALDQMVWIAQNGLDGYLAADFNGDIFVDALDQVIWITYNGLGSFLPCGFTVDPVSGVQTQNAPNYDAKRSSKLIFEKKKQNNQFKNDTKQDNRMNNETKQDNINNNRK